MKNNIEPEVKTVKIKKTPKTYTSKQIIKTLIAIVVISTISSVSTLFISGIVTNYINSEVQSQVKSFTKE